MHLFEQLVFLHRRAGPLSRAARAMLIRFFFMLRAAGVPVTLTEYLTLLEALEARRRRRQRRRFLLPRAHCLVKDEKHFDRFDRAFAAHFKGAEQLFEKLHRANSRPNGCKQLARAHC